MSQSEAPAADWYQDPSGRFQFRYWDGETWTGHVSTDGETEWDPPTDDPEVGEAAAVEESVAPVAEAEAEAVSIAPAEVQPSEPEESAVAPAPVEATGGTIEDGEPSDTNLVANQRAGVDDDIVEWVDEVAGQVEPRLSRINRSWTSQPQAEAARACAYGLLLGHLARLHPHMRRELSQVAEAHPSFTTLKAGSRLTTLEEIAGDAQRSAAWLGPLIGEESPDQVRMLFD